MTRCWIKSGDLDKMCIIMLYCCINNIQINTSNIIKCINDSTVNKGHLNIDRTYSAIHQCLYRLNNAKQGIWCIGDTSKFWLDRISDMRCKLSQYKFHIEGSNVKLNLSQITLVSGKQKGNTSLNRILDKTIHTENYNFEVIDSLDDYVDLIHKIKQTYSYTHIHTLFTEYTNTTLSLNTIKRYLNYKKTDTHIRKPSKQFIEFIEKIAT